MNNINSHSMEAINSHIPPKNSFSPLFKFKHLEDQLLIGVDIGGSLVKLSIVIKKTEIKAKEYFEKTKLFEMLEEKEHYLFLTTFPSEDFITKITLMLKEASKFCKIKIVQSTGGGAFKYKDLVKEKFGIIFEKHDELISLVQGYLFFNSFNSFYKIEGMKEIIFVPPSDLIFPHLAVNIGSGVSILKVDSPDPKDIHRVSGSIMGGGTLIGISKILLGIDKYSEIIELAKQGDYRNTDYTLKDVYNFVGGKPSVDDFHVASSLAKVQEQINLNKSEKYSKADIALSLLIMVCLHITQISSLAAMEHGVEQILVFGNFSRRGSYAVFCLNQGYKFYGKNLKIRYNYYDGFPGVTGVLIENREKQE